MRFEWAGTDRAGVAQCGTIDAKSQSDAATKIRAKGFYVDQVVAVDDVPAAKRVSGETYIAPFSLARIALIIIATLAFCGAVYALAIYDVSVPSRGDAGRIVNLQRVGDRLAYLVFSLSIFVSASVSACVVGRGK